MRPVGHLVVSAADMCCTAMSVHRAPSFGSCHNSIVPVADWAILSRNSTVLKSKSFAVLPTMAHAQVKVRCSSMDVQETSHLSDLSCQCEGLHSCCLRFTHCVSPEVAAQPSVPELASTQRGFSRTRCFCNAQDCVCDHMLAPSVILSFHPFTFRRTLQRWKLAARAEACFVSLRSVILIFVSEHDAVRTWQARYRSLAQQMPKALISLLRLWNQTARQDPTVLGCVLLPHHRKLFQFVVRFFKYSQCLCTLLAH